MTVFQALILGIVQGLTEMLPVSSSAHLFLIPWFFNWQIPDSFDVALHAGTLLAVGIFFFKDWVKLIKGAYKQTIKRESNRDGTMFWYLVFATIPGGIIGFILDKYFEDYIKNPIIIAVALIVMGILFYIVDKKSPNNTKYEKMTFKQTFLIGLSQALAFIPGVSRSGITMTTGRAMGIERESVAKYSFMLSTPIILGATIYKFKDFVFDMPFVVGVLISFLVGIFVIRFLLDYLKKGDFKWFALYRVTLGLFVVSYAIVTTLAK